MGKYDIPAVISYVLTTTGRSTMSYVGHSMGCAMFYVCMIEHPELNAKIDVMIALSSGTSVVYSKANVRYKAPFINQLWVVCCWMPLREMLHHSIYNQHGKLKNI